MEITFEQILIGFITLFTQIIEALAGFGATAVGLPFAAIFMTTGEASAVLNLQSFIITIIIMILTRKQINLKEYAKIVLLILPFLPIGFLIGSSLKAYDMYLKILLGIVISFVSLRYLFYTKIRKTAPATLKPSSQYLALFSGAVVHGIFATGGPLITLYTANKIPEKGEFRATMCAFWTTINIFLIGFRLFSGVYTKPVVSTFIVTLPFLAVGLFIGMHIHKKIQTGTFSDLIYYILLAGGLISLFVGAADIFG